MSDPADQLSVQGPIAVSQSQVQFIINALRAGKRAILVSGQNPFQAHVPDEALAACLSAAVSVLRIRHPLPSVLELQDLIGSTVGITGGLGIAPKAMARLLLASVPPWQSVVLAIDDADALPRQSLYYLAQLSTVLPVEARALQIVFAAGPALLERLSHPDFETFRDRMVVSSEKNLEQEDDRMKSLPAQARGLQVIAPRPVGQEDDRMKSLPAQARGLQGIAPRSVGQEDDRMNSQPAQARGLQAIAPRLVKFRPLSTAPQRPRYLTGREALDLMANNPMLVVITIVCLLAMGYAAFLTFSNSQTRPSALGVNSSALQDFAVAPQSSPPTPPNPRETDKAIASLIDQFEAAMAQELSGARPGGEAAKLADRIETLAKSASTNGRLMVVAFEDRIVTSVIGALQAGRPEEAHRLEQFLGRSGNSRSNAASSNGAPSQSEATARPQAPRPNDGGEAQAAAKTDQPIMFPDLVVSAAAPLDNPEPPVAGTQRPQVPAIQDKGATVVSADLPAFAPIRVVLTYPRNDKAAAQRTAALRQALTAAKVDVVRLEAVDASHPTLAIGYYFRSDRDAAVDVSRRVEPLLGRVEPVVLELRRKVPPPGTIEIALPGQAAVSDRVHRNHSTPIRRVRVSNLTKRIVGSFSLGH